MIDRREAIEKSKTMKRTIFYLFCIWGLTVSSAVAQKRTVSHETGTFVGESSAERPERRVSVSPDGVTVTYEFKHAVVLSDPDVADYYLWRISGFGHSVVPASRTFRSVGTRSRCPKAVPHSPSRFLKVPVSMCRCASLPPVLRSPRGKSPRRLFLTSLPTKGGFLARSWRQAKSGCTGDVPWRKWVSIRCDTTGRTALCGPVPRSSIG